MRLAASSMRSIALSGRKRSADVAVGQHGGGVQGLVGDADAVVSLVAVAQALEDLLGLFDGRLVDA